MKIYFLIFAIICGSYADIYGRLDSFQDIGYLTPQNNFIIYDNVYFRTYFDKVNDTVNTVTIKQFYSSLENGTRVLFYNNGVYTDASNEVYLILGNRNNLNDITIVLNLHPSIFDVAKGERQTTAFTMDLEIHFKNSGITHYPITSQINIGNSKRESTTGTPSFGFRTEIMPILVVSIIFGMYFI